MREVAKNIIFLGGQDRTQKIFEGEIPLSKGMSYNSYLIMDKKTCLLDSCDESILDSYIPKLEEALNGRELDYFVIHHLEPDHTAGITKIMELHPNVKIFISALGLSLLKQFFRNLKVTNFQLIKEHDQLNLGEHCLSFIAAPMVHWPEVMMSYEISEKILFSADAFGSFTCYDDLDSSNYEDQAELLYEERRYYTNIVGKYGDQVQAVLKKAANLEINMICSLHGPMHTKRIPDVIKYYDLWSKYQAEREGVLVVYATIYGHSAEAAKYLDESLTKAGYCHDLVNLNKSDFSVALAKSFIYDKIICIAPTFNMGLFPKMREYIEVLCDHGVRNKTFALVENGSWAPQAKNIMSRMLSTLKDCTIVPTSLTIKSSLDDSDYPTLEQIIDELAIKEKGCKANGKVRKFSCKICGFVYEGDELPSDFRCPICGHPAEDFEEIE